MVGVCWASSKIIFAPDVTPQKPLLSSRAVKKISESFTLAFESYDCALEYLGMISSNQTAELTLETVDFKNRVVRAAQQLSLGVYLDNLERLGGEAFGCYEGTKSIENFSLANFYAEACFNTILVASGM
jgi:hypothetical protein